MHVADLAEERLVETETLETAILSLSPWEAFVVFAVMNGMSVRKVAKETGSTSGEIRRVVKRALAPAAPRPPTS